jgi:hypothetical protein
MCVRLDNPGQEAGGRYKVAMKRAHPRSPFLEQLYRSRPDLEALVNSGDEAVFRRIVELEAMQKMGGNQNKDLKLPNRVDEQVDKPE